MKKFTMGFLTAALLFTAIPVGAAIEEYICYKADYKVMVNGTEYISNELPVLNYKGNTYAPFRSILEAAGLTVSWNAELSQAEVTVPDTTVAKKSTGITQTPDGITQIDTWEGKQYISFTKIQLAVRPKGYDLMFDIHGKTWKLVKGDEVIMGNVPVTMVYAHDSVEVDYYINTILPLIK